MPIAVMLKSELSIGDLLVAIGTLALAGVTWLLARSTKQEVQLSQQGLALTRDSVEAIDRPFLVAHPDRFDLQPVFDKDSDEPIGEAWALYATLENLGKGPAIFDGARLLNDAGLDLVGRSWKVELILKPSETSDIGISLKDTAPEHGTALTLCLGYRSASGAPYVTRHQIEVARYQRVIRFDFRREAVDLRDVGPREGSAPR